jgi:hypothetical protein
VTGFLCWRDSHPLEWQLASLHDHFETLLGLMARRQEELAQAAGELRAWLEQQLGR